MTITPAEPIEILTDNRPFGSWSWLGLLFNVALGVAVTILGISAIQAAAHLLSTGDYNKAEAADPIVLLVFGAILVAVGLLATYKFIWQSSRRTWLVQPAERFLLIRAKWPLWQVLLVFQFHTIKDIRVG
jgi:protein-S-isoprenylcysteine O-methyltransferase Ste14